MSTENDGVAGPLVLRLGVTIHARAMQPEAWHARFTRMIGESGDESAAAASADEQLVAEADVCRVHFSDAAWAEALVSGGPDLAAIAEAFQDRDLLSLTDEELLFADGLVVVRSISVADGEPVWPVRRALTQAIARVFDTDIIVLGMPSDQIRELEADGADKGWQEMGFVGMPGTQVMLLLNRARP